MTDRLELWAGVECTVNRVGDRFFDQIGRTGHALRDDDVDRLVDLGITAVRYPVLWEKTAPRGVASADWSWLDHRLEALRSRGVRVIAGLVHHGSGPEGTSLLEESFVEGLAAFAGAVAARWPWLEDFTPVNEPLTTARFSALYGHWYPHRRDTASFLRALLIETRATRAAMRAIRQVTPRARLVQTEDLGRTYGTPRLAAQIDYENHRRWLSLDLLFGRVGADHPLHAHLLDHGVGADVLASLVDAPCPPDLVGANYYVTSDRFLDDRLGCYPPSLHGGNGRDLYVDVEAVRARPEGIAGHAAVLRAAWDRYRAPLAVTEVHLGCTPEEQLRWLTEAWRGAEDARRAGADVRACTVWSAFGSSDWDSLVTRDAGRYEPGAYDVRGATPRPTAIAHAARQLARHGATTHPLADDDGWWARDDRLLPHVVLRPRPSRNSASRRPCILVTGAGGALGRAVVAACKERRLEVLALTRSSLDVTDAEAVAATLDGVRPWLVINAAGFGCAVSAEIERERCQGVHAHGAAALARACDRAGARLVTFSSAFVFAGDKGGGYVEDDPVSPRCAFGESHAAAEREVRGALAHALVVRAGSLFGPDEHRSLLSRALATVAAGGRVEAAEDGSLSPAYLPHVAHAALDLAVDHAEGVWHLANAGLLSPASWLRAGCTARGLPSSAIVPASAAAPRGRGGLPRQAGLISRRWSAMPSLDAALAAYGEACVRQVAVASARVVHEVASPRASASLDGTPTVPS